MLTGFINETGQLLDSFWKAEEDLSGTYRLLEELWELMYFQEENGILTSRTENFLKFCMNQTVENNTWLPVDDVSECAAEFTEFKNHFRYILSYPEVKLPHAHGRYGLPNDDDHDDDNGCTCIHDPSIPIPCHIEYFDENRDSENRDEGWCFLAVNDTWKTQDCYNDTLELSSSLIQATSFAEALCYAQEISKVSQLCRTDWATLRWFCHWTSDIKKKATRSKDRVLKVEDSARRTEPLLIRWRDHVLDIGFHNSFPVQVVNVNF